MSKLHRVLPAVLTFALAACAAAASPPPSGPGASPGPSGNPDGETIEHPTGATDVVLRLHEIPGFVLIDIAAGQMPWFTLYGDGTVIFQPQTEFFPEADPDGIIRMPAHRTARLDETQVQELLRFAIADGGLGLAATDYRNDMVADASTAVFTIRAGGLDKTVSVYALGMPDPTGANAEIFAALEALAERLRDFDDAGSIPTDAFEPTGWRAILIESELAGPNGAVAWPWPNLTVADFPADVNGEGAAQFPHRNMSVEEVAAIGVEDAPGGFSGLTVTGPDGTFYIVVIRPLLPDQAS